MNRASWMGMGSALVASIAVLAGAQGIVDTPETVIYSVEGGMRYDDNRDATKNDKESQFSVKMTPGVRLTLDDERTKAFLLYKPSLLWRDNTRDDQNETELYNMAEINVDHRISSLWKVGALDRYEKTDDPNVTEGGTTVRENASYWDNDAKGWTAYTLSERVQVDLDASYYIKRYDDNDYADDADEDRIKANTGLRYKLQPDFETFGFLGYDRPTYDSSLIGDYHGYLAGVGVSRAFSDRLQGSASAGLMLVDYGSAETDDETSPFFQLSGELKVSDTFRLQSEAGYSIEPSDRSYYSSKLYSRALLRGIYRLTDSLTAEAQVLYANGEYDSDTAIQESAGLTDLLDDGDDTLMDYRVGMTFRPPARRYYVGVAYEYEDWDSDVRESFARNTVSALAGMEF